MRTFLILLVLTLTNVTFSQTNDYVNNPNSKIFQGALFSGVTNLLLLNTDTFEEQPILRHATSVLATMLVESTLNGFKSDKMGYVALGGVTASVTIDIFKPKRRSYVCGIYRR